MPLTDQEMELERRMADLVRLGYSVDIDVVAGIRVGVVDPRGNGMPWAARLSRGVAYPEGFGNSGIEALEDAVDQAWAQGAQ